MNAIPTIHISVSLFQLCFTISQGVNKIYSFKNIILLNFLIYTVIDWD